MSKTPSNKFPHQTVNSVNQIVVSPTQFYTTLLTGRYRDEISVLDLINAGLEEDSPYHGEGAHVPDPDTYMGSTAAGMSQFEIAQWKSALDSMDTDVDFDTFMDQAVSSFPSVTTSVEAVHSSERASVSSALSAAASAASSAVEDTPISDMVTAYEDRIKKQYLRAISRLASSMADINAVNSSAFVFGMAGINRQLLEDVNSFDANLSMEAYKSYLSLYMSVFSTTFQTHVMRAQSNDQMKLQSSMSMMQYETSRIQGKGQLADIQERASLNRLNAHIAEQMNRLALEEKDSLYDFTLFAKGYNMLSPGSAAAVVPGHMSGEAQVLTGAATGAALGMGVAGPLGALAGAGVGALAGAFG